MVTQTTKLIHKVGEPAYKVHLVQGLHHSSLLSISKFADDNYITIFTPQDVKVSDGKKNRDFKHMRAHTSGVEKPGINAMERPLSATKPQETPKQTKNKST